MRLASCAWSVIAMAWAYGFAEIATMSPCCWTANTVSAGRCVRWVKTRLGGRYGNAIFAMPVNPSAPIAGGVG